MSEGIINIIVAAIGILGGGAGVFTFILGRKKENRDDFDIIIKTWKEDNQRLREKEAALTERVEILEQSISSLRTKVVLLESAHMDLPIPMWLKDTKGVMLALNAAYEDTFLTPNGLSAESYIGNTDYDVWPKDIADAFRAHDAQVQRTGRTFFGSEMVPIGGAEIEYRIIKYVRYAGRAKIGIGGLAIPIELSQ